MLNDFLTQTCNITRKTTTNTDWIIKATISTIYSGILCYSYQYRGSLENTELAQNTSKELKKVIIEPDKVSVRQWDILELIDWNIWNLWKYEILLNPKWNYLIDWTLDSIELIIRQI